MIDDIDKYVAKKLKYYRTKFDWPLKKLADDLDVSLQQMHRYEQGTNKISAGLLYKLAKVFQIEISCFFDKFEAGELKTILTMNIFSGSALVSLTNLWKYMF